MDVMRTEQTYATRENAIKKLTKEVGDLTEFHCRWLIAVNEAGRFAPVVIANPGKFHEVNHLIFRGITVTN